VPRNGSGVYTKPVGSTAVSGTTIEATKYNATIDDLVADANSARPIVAGGTGGTSKSSAQSALGIVPFDGPITLNETQIAQVFANLQMTASDPEWTGLVSASLPSRIGYAQMANPSSSLNDVLETGTYRLQHGMTGGPVGVNVDYSILTVGRYIDTLYQSVVIYSTGQEWTRGGELSGAVWIFSPWVNAKAGGDADYLKLSGGALSGAIGVAAPGNGSVRLDGGSASAPGYISFHTSDGVWRGFIGWQYGETSIGIVGENGWNYNFSDVPTVTSYPIIHSGSLASYLAALPLDAVGTHAFCSCSTGPHSAGALVAGSVLTYADTATGLSGTPTGTWRVMGYLGSAPRKTLFQKVA